MIRIFIIFISLFFYSHSYGFQGYSVNFKNIDNKQGLSQNGVITIFQDRNGFMWFGTHYGLNRYDGLNIKTYYAGSSFNELSDNTINSIVQDLPGNIWIATDQGVSVFNPQTEKFYNLNKYGSKNNIFIHNIQSMKLIDGKIMLTSSKGLWSIDPGKNLFTDEITKSICNNINSYKISSILNSEFLKIYKKDKNDSYWLTTKNQIIVAKIINNQLLVIDKININPIADVEITSFFEDNFSNLWVGTENNGLYHLKDNKGSYLVTKIYPKNSTSINFSRITDIIQDSQNNLIVTSRSDGAILIPKDALEKSDFTTVPINSIDLQTQKIRSIYLSRDNTLWVGSLGNGIFFENNSGLKFKNYQIRDEKNNSVINNTRSILKDTYGRLWMGTLFEGLCIYDINSQKTQRTLLDGKSIFALSPIDNNHILVGSSNGLYLVTFDKNNFTTKKLNVTPKIDNVVFSITHANNNYWIGTDNALISFTLPDDFEISNIIKYADEKPLGFNSLNAIRVVKYDALHNILWIGSQASSLIKAQLNNDFTIKEFYAVNNSFNKEEISEYICDIFIDSENNCWIGSRNGLIHINLSKNGAITGIKKFTDVDGFPSNLVQSIESDKEGNLWIGTNKGLVKFNKKNYEVVNYDINDGIQDYEFIEHSSYLDSNGLLYFGGIHGISEFAPNNIKYSNSAEPVNIMEIFINGINTTDRRPFNDSIALSLSNFENNLKFNFLSPNYTNPKKCKYSYILEGFDEKWTITAANVYTAEYSNLPKGNYTFKVKASNEDGIWNPDYTSLSIEIQPSFWITFPAIIIYISLLTVLIILISTVAKKRFDIKNKGLLEKQYHDQMEKVNESKLEFFINISHEIRTPLTLILCSIEKLISNFKLDHKQEKEALTIDKNVHRILELTNELLAIRKMETGNYQLKVQKNDIIKFLKDIKIAFRGLAKKKEIKISIVSYKPEIFIWFDRNALGKIIYNLISNGIKYTNQGGNIKIKINPSKNNKFIEIEVVDNGIGIDTNYLPKIFNRFYHHGDNLDRYAHGFGIGLSLTKSLIELHKGNISVNSNLNKGSVFTLSLPLDENAYSDEEKADRAIWNNNLPTVLSSTNFDESDEIINNELVIENVGFNASKPTILYVDDNTELLENISDYFSDSYNIFTAENGKDGIKMAHKLQPDVIISDIVMPVMDGIELCITLKNDINTSHIPIILLTAKGDIDSQLQGVQSGADYFIPKPFNIKLLNLTIKNLIESRNQLKNLFVTNEYEDAGDITTNNKDKEFIDKLLKYVNDHIDDDNLNINYIADVFAMSRSTFFRKVKVITGTTGKQFIDAVRLKKATNLLIESDLNISEIAYAIGHSNPQYFSKWFKSNFKISPSEYILKNKK